MSSLIDLQDNREDAEESNPSHPRADPAAIRRAEAETRRLAKSHYENFVVASLLLPRRLRQPFYNVYAFCRTADDLADESASPDQALQQLARFRHQLDQSFAGRPTGNLFLALSGTVRQFGLEQQPFHDLLDAFVQDQRVTRYRSIDELLGYCRRSANPVGRIVLRLAGVDDRTNNELSDQICTGLQLANFWQDVARDFAIGRVYLPQDEMSRFGVDESMLSLPSAPKPLRNLLRSECDRAEEFFHRGLALADRVPNWFSRNIKLFAHGGLATLNAIAAIDYDVLASRPTVSRRQQCWLIVKATLGTL